MTKQLFLKFSKNETIANRQDVGMGCGSYTMVMPDTRISIYAAGMAEKARHIIEKGCPENGELWIGLLDESDMGVQLEKIFSKAVIRF